MIEALRLAALAGLIALSALAGPRSVEAQPADAEQAREQPNVAARIAALRAELQRDRERLEAILSTPITPESPPLRSNPELRRIAKRLPRLQQELRELEQHALEPGPPTPPSAR